MKVYGVFAGGGVKGAALAGCLDAAAAKDLEFVGYGGTSAGAIVATLAAAGYNGSEICELMKTKLSPMKLLDDDGKRFEEALDVKKKIEERLNSSLVRAYFNVPLDYLKLKPLLERHGLYSGDKFRKTLLDLLRDKLGLPEDRKDVLFSDFSKPLKIVASDILERRTAKFSLEDSTYGESVTEAVVASASYPFLFQPRPITEGGQGMLLDGGLSSNLPTFLFAREQRQTQYPILAFDLKSAAKKDGKGQPFMRFLENVLNTALESADEIIHDLGPGVRKISVPIPKKIDTLKLDLEEEDIVSLFNSGVTATNKSLRAWPMMRLATAAGVNISHQLSTVYGDRKLFEGPLFALTQSVASKWNAKGLRAHIMLSTGRETNSRIVVYTHGFRETDADSDLELDEHGGCTGKAIADSRAAIADLEDAKRTFDKEWRMKREEQAKIPQDRKSMISVPVFAVPENPADYYDEKKEKDAPIVGTLSIDSSTALSGTSWLVPGGLDEDLVALLKWHARTIAKLLR